MRVIGHQGSQDGTTGNTIEAFTAAIDAKVDAIETDLQITKDGEVVIFHDFFLGQKRIKDLLLSEIQAKTDILTLSQFLSLLKASKIKANLELKRDPLHTEYSYPAKEYVNKVLQIIDDFEDPDRIYFSSFDPETLSILKEKHPDALIAFLYNQESLDCIEKITKRADPGIVLEIAHSFGAKILSPQYELITDPKIVKQLQKAHFLVHPWTINDEKEWKRCIELGVDGIITDYPQKLKESLHAP